MGEGGCGWDLGGVGLVLCFLVVWSGLACFEGVIDVEADEEGEAEGGDDDGGEGGGGEAGASGGRGAVGLDGHGWGLGDVEERL